MAGRKQDLVWSKFRRMKIDNHYKAECKACGLVLMGLVVRLKKHAEACPAEQQQADVEGEEGGEYLGAGEAAGDPPSSGGSSNTQTPTKASSSKSNGMNIMKFAVKTTKKDRDMLDLQIAKTIFATNSPFRLADHPEFQKMIQLLRPGYSSPSRLTVSDKLLSKVYEDVKSDCSRQLEGQVVCLSLDGWSNVHNEPIVSSTITASDGSIFLVDSVDTSGESHTAEYLTDLAKAAMEKSKEEFACKVGSIVTDNAANVKKMRANLEEDDSNLITYGCSSHLMNLLAHDLEIPNVTEHVVQCMKFRNSHFALARYREEGGSALIMPQEVRWNTMCDCCEAYLKNWHIFLKICETDREKIDSTIRNKISNMGIKRSVEELVGRLKPIAVALDRLQRDSCLAADAVTVWKSLREELPNQKEVRKKFDERYKQALTPAHLLSNLLHPHYRGANISLEEKEMAYRFAAKRPGVATIVTKFEARAPPFLSSKFLEEVTSSVSPQDWWLSHREELPDEMIDLVQQLFTAVASSSGVERVFSTFGLVQSKLRNRLGTEKAAKLVFLYKALNQEGQKKKMN